MNVLFSKTFLMEDHNSALTDWKYTGTHIIHVGAYNNIAWVGQEKVAEIKKNYETKILKYSFYPIYCIICNIFDLINMALALVIADSITWVIPDWMWDKWVSQDNIRESIRRKFAQTTQGIHPTNAEVLEEVSDSFQIYLNRGTLIFCRLRNILPPYSGPVFLDIDADFLVEIISCHPDKIWLTPEEFLRVLQTSRDLKEKFLTIELFSTIHPSFNKVLYNWGDVYELAGRSEEALDVFEQALTGNRFIRKLLCKLVHYSSPTNWIRPRIVLCVLYAIHKIGLRKS